jgi:hypothetical protein
VNITVKKPWVVAVAVIGGVALVVIVFALAFVGTHKDAILRAMGTGDRTFNRE